VQSLDIRTELKTALNKVNDNPLKAFLPFVLAVLVIATLIVLISAYLSAGILFSFNYFSSNNSTPIGINTFINQNSSGLIGIFTNSLLTTGLIIFSALSVFSAQRTLKQSQREQQIRDIEKRLELFYIPAENIMTVADEYMKNPSDTNYYKIIDYEPRRFKNQDASNEELAIRYVSAKLKEIKQFRYLATRETCKLFKRYLFEEESNEVRESLSKSVENDVKEYVKRLYELKQE
jgi:hypothetical protein